MADWINRTDALALLGVKAQTLYAYVSRGRIEVRRETGGPRRSLYRAEDVIALSRQAGASRKPSSIAAGSLAWGEGSIVTRLSTVRHGRLIYCGVDAADFSGSATLEDTAALLWGSDGEIVFSVPDLESCTPFEVLARLADESQPSIGRSADRLRRDACISIAHAARACGVGAGVAPLHLGLASLWSLGIDDTDLVRRALVLVADHELNASAFAARVAASTGAPMAACLLAGLSTLAGPRHGGASSALAHMLGDAARIGPDAAMRLWLERGGGLPGFGHPLYPAGDIRAIVLGQALESDPLMLDLAQCVREETGRLPNIDFSLVAIARKARLSAGAPFHLFLLGRSVGWAAHAIEQALDGNLIRPRARYEGALPV